MSLISDMKIYLVDYQLTIEVECKMKLLGKKII